MENVLVKRDATVKAISRGGDCWRLLSRASATEAMREIRLATYDALLSDSKRGE